MAQGPAMTRAQAEQSILSGAEVVEAEISAGWISSAQEKWESANHSVCRHRRRAER